MKRSVVAVIATLAMTLSCAAPPPPAPVKKEPVPQWADVFRGTPDIYASVRVQALKRDVVYGALWQALLRAAQARGFARGATMVEAVEGAEEIIVGLNRGADAALILRGVPASLDPGAISDADGRPLFHPASDRAKVPEYELYDRASAEGSFFVLPDRTWVGALGEARARARQVFVTPLNRPAPAPFDDALVAVRFGGPIAHALDRHPDFGALTKKLVSARFMLKPAKGGLVVALDYPDAATTALGEAEAKRLVVELSKDDKRFGWLKPATVAHEEKTVFVRVAIPSRLLEELPNASGADLPF